MAFEKNVPIWNAPGTEPPESLKNSGFESGYKPPADFFNWFWHNVGLCLMELREKIGGTVVDSSHDLNDYCSVGVYTYSAGSAETIANVPEKAQGTLVVLPRLVANDPANVIQIVISRENNIYVRNRYDGSWKGWDKTASESALNSAISNHGRHVPDNCAQISNWDTAVKTGWYMGNNAANAPTNYENSAGSLWYFGFVVAHNENYVFQEVYQFTASTDAISIPKYIRARKDGVWGEWHKVTVQRDVPYDAKLDYIKTIKGNVQDQIDNKLDAKPSFIEFRTTATAGNGGYLDFHFNGSESDYTARVIEEAEGQLGVLASMVRFTGNLKIAAGKVSLQGDASTANIMSFSDPTNDYKRTLQLANAGYQSNVANSLVLIQKDSSGSKNYKIYGEHNKPTHADVGAVRFDVLWENASPSSSFVAQDISINASGYDGFIILARSSTSVVGIVNAIMIGTGTGRLQFANGGSTTGAAAHRSVQVSATKMSVTGASYNGAASDNHLIPTKLIGIKGVN